MFHQAKVSYLKSQSCRLYHRTSTEQKASKEGREREGIDRAGVMILIS